MRPRILLAIHRPDWAFANIARQLERNLSGEFRFTIAPYETVTGGTYDAVVCFWWPTVPTLRARVPARRYVLALYDEYYWRPTSRIPPLMPPALAAADLIGCGNEGFLDLLRSRFPGQVPPTYVIEDGVDTDLFRPKPMPAEFAVGWTGNSGATAATSGGDERKGYRFIAEACELAGVPLRKVDIAVEIPKSHEEMADWYGGISVYVNAADSEGAPNTIFEAAATGRPAITTRVGMAQRLVLDGGTGFFLEERSSAAIAAAIRRAQAMGPAGLETMGRLARLSAEAHDWRYKARYWRTLLAAATH